MMSGLNEDGLKTGARGSGLPVRSSDDEDVLLRVHSVHFGEDLVDDTVSSTATISDGSTTSLGDRVQLVKEEDTRGSGTGLVEHVTNIGLRLSEPHRKKLGTL